MQDIQEKYIQQFQAVLDSLNIAQRKAVDTIDGPVLVVAGPGTGKTQILSARIGNILLNTDTSFHNILCLTYTDAGAIAMRKRLMQFVGPDANNIHIFTFHAFCNEVIRHNADLFGHYDLQPLGELEQIDIMMELIDAFADDHPLKRFKGEVYYERRRLQPLFAVMKSENWSPEYIIKKTEEYCEELKNSDEYIYKVNGKGYKKGDFKQKIYEGDIKKYEPLKAAAKEFDNYVALLQKYKRYDFNDMILWVLNAFKEHEDLLLKYQEQYLYILVDEFQDTNGAQNDLISCLASYWEDRPNLFVVGDDDQSIYRFQGASVANIIQFQKNYQSEIETIVLEKNYRSSQNILDASNAVISQNKQRLINEIPGLNKELIAEGSFADLAIKPTVIECNSKLEEIAYLAQSLEKSYKEGADMSEIAVIYRKHSQVADLVALLEKANIPLDIKQRIDIFTLPFIKNIIQLLTYIEEESKAPRSRNELLFQILYYPWFGIEALDVETLSHHISQNKLSWRQSIASKELLFKLGLHNAKSISAFSDAIENLLKTAYESTLQMLFEKLIVSTGIMTYVMQSPDRTWLLQVLTTFFDFIKQESVKNPSISLKDFLAVLDKMAKFEVRLPVYKAAFSEKGINFITVHSAKGLEFKTVFMISCQKEIWEKDSNQGRYSMPLNLIGAKDEEGKIEEERRLFFVGMTRAKKNLIISYYNKNEKEKDSLPVRFIDELFESGKCDLSTANVSQDQLIQYCGSLLQGVEKPKITLIDHNLIDQSLRGFRMSTTSLNKYLQCPLAFYFEKIVQVPSARNANMGFGSAIHKALEDLFREMLISENKTFPSKESLVNYFNIGLNHYKSHFTEKEYKDYTSYGKKILEEYYDEYCDKWAKVVVNEYPIPLTHYNGVPLSGKLDKLEFNGNDVNVVDYKTGKPDYGKTKLYPPSENNPLGGDYWRQIVFYKILMDADKSKPWNMLSGEMIFLEKDKNDSYFSKKLNITADDITVVGKQITETYTKILAHEFDEGCGEPDCYWCNMVKNNMKVTDKEGLFQSNDDEIGS